MSLPLHILLQLPSFHGRSPNTWRMYFIDSQIFKHMAYVLKHVETCWLNQQHVSYSDIQQPTKPRNNGRAAGGICIQFCHLRGRGTDATYTETDRNSQRHLLGGLDPSEKYGSQLGRSSPINIEGKKMCKNSTNHIYDVTYNPLSYPQRTSPC